MLKLSKLFKVLLVILGLAVLSFFIPTGYVLISPGSAEDLSKLVAVEGADTHGRGKFFLVTVSQQPARLLFAIYGFLHPHIEIESLANVIPPGMQEDEYRQLLEQWMNESKLTAQVIALRRAGYQVEIISEGIIVEGLLEESPTKGILEKGDIIIAADGDPVYLANELISVVQDRRVGDAVRLTVLRDEEQLDPVINTAPHPDNPDLPALGVYIRTLHWEPVLPVAIDFQTREIAGPSAGMMFVLEIMNQLSPRDLTGGRLIAGTGTIDINEEVGRIGGVFQKVIAAEQAGAEFFIVPEGNYEEARKAVRHLELVPVETLQDALDFLDSLLTSRAAPGPVSELFFSVHGIPGSCRPAASISGFTLTKQLSKS